MNKCVYILVSFFLCLACSENRQISYPRYTDFPEIRTIQTEVANIDTILLRYPFRVVVQDSVAVVMDLHNLDHYLHAFTYPEWKHIVSFGRRGQGPEEMLSADNIQFNSLDSLWAIDANKMEITRWQISPTDGSAERVEEIKLDKTLVRSLDFHLKEDGFLIPDYMGEHRYWMVNNKGKTVESFSEIPSEKADKNTVRPALAQAWRSFMDYNPKNSVLAMVTQLGEVLEIYNLKDSTHNVHYGPHGEPEYQTTVDGKSIPNGIMGFSDVKVTDRYIYAVFQNIHFKDLFSSRKKGIEPENGAKYIYMFDLKGKPIRQYELDCRINSIHIIEETNTVVATAAKSDDPIILFKL